MASMLFFLALVTAAQAALSFGASNGSYICNPAHQYPAGQICVNGTGSPVLSTITVVTAITTVCPTPTILTYGNKTYTIKSSTTLTITDCPCTLTKSVAPSASVVVPKVASSGSVRVTSGSQVCTVRASASAFSSPGPPVIAPPVTTVTSATPATPITPVTTANTVNPPATVATATTPATAATASARYTGAGEKLGSNAALVLGVLGLLAL